MGTAQQRGASALEVLGGWVVTQVGRKVHVNVGGARGVQCTVPRATQDGDPGHCHGLVPSDEEAGGAGGEHGGDVVGEGTERRGFDGPDAPQADLVSLGVNAAGFERYGVAQANEVGECRCTPSQATSAFVCALKRETPARISRVTTAPFGSVTGRKDAPRRSSGWCVITMS